MLNQVTLIGRVGKNPETRDTQGGQVVANFSLATDEWFKGHDGQKQKKTDWHNLVFWGKLADIVQQYVKKGDLLAVVGKIQTRSWEDKNGGGKRYTTEIIVQTMKMLGGNRDGGAETTSQPARDGMAKPAAGVSRGGYKPAPATARPVSTVSQPVDDFFGAGSEISDEDVPF